MPLSRRRALIALADVCWPARPSLTLAVPPPPRSSASCSRCRESGRGRWRTSRCARCVIPTRSCPPTSACAAVWSGWGVTADRRVRSASRGAGVRTGRTRAAPGPNSPRDLTRRDGAPFYACDENHDSHTTRPLRLRAEPIGRLLLCGDEQRLSGLYTPRLRRTPTSSVAGDAPAPRSFASVSNSRPTSLVSASSSTFRSTWTADPVPP